MNLNLYTIEGSNKTSRKKAAIELDLVIQQELPEVDGFHDFGGAVEDDSGG